VSLTAGDRLGPYQIVALAGAGGMGEVYKAFDTRLDRTVAIKVLPAPFAADLQFRERFDREARIISQLDHPHICALYDVGEAVASSSAPSSDPVRFLVIQYLEGETLAARIAKGPLPLKDALGVAVQIADALDRAHRAGIVHRDLKPGNVMLTRTGAKLLDFGLATARGVAANAGLSMLPTTPPNLTAQGTILGTFQYMAPEQLEGKDADARSDLFAFGAVLHEMLTGRKAFSGSSHASLISAIMSSQPSPVSTSQALAPAELDHLVARCLAKDPEDRWQSARDLKLQLSWIAETTLSPAAPLRQKKRSREFVAWAVASLTLVAAVTAIVAGRRTPAPVAEAVQFGVSPPEKTTFSVDLNAQAISHDGRQLAVVATNAQGTPHLWIRRLDAPAFRALAGTDGAAQPFWSPDGRSLGFFAGGKLKTIDVQTGAPQTLADAPFPLGGTWNREGIILFGRAIGSPIMRVAAAGGGAATPATSLAQTNNVAAHGAPFFLPDGQHFFFLAGTGPKRGTVYVGSLGAKDVRRLAITDSAAVYSSPGYVLFVRKSTLMAQRFDLATLSTQGDAVAVADGVGSSSEGISVPVSDDETLMFRQAVSGLARLAWMNRAGQLQETRAPVGFYQDIVLSLDDTQIAFSRDGELGTDVWLLNFGRGITSRFTFNPPLSNVPIWSPDGRQIVFASARNGHLDLFRRASDLSGADEQFLKLDAIPILFPSDWSADGRFVSYYRTDPKTQLDIWTVSTGADRTPVQYLHGNFNESQGQFSPDGRWMAYVSDESGAPQVYVQSFPTVGGQRQISAEGGTQPRWRRDGKELFYIAPDRKLMAVTVKAGSTFEADAPHALFQTEINVSELRQAYAVSGDGQRFLLKMATEAGSSPMTVILNWPALLKK